MKHEINDQLSCLWIYLIGGEPTAYLASAGVFCNLAFGWFVALRCAHRKNPDWVEEMLNEPTKEEEEELREATVGKNK